MSNVSVLTIEGAGSSRLQSLFRQWGYNPTSTQSMWTAVSAIRSKRFSAVIIDLHRIIDDILELVLSIRDVNEVVPIVVVGEPADDQVKRALQNRTKVYLLDDRQDDALRVRIARVMDYRSRKNGN